MAGSVNKVILVGNLGKDPEVRFMQDGGRVANLSIATGESWKDKVTGERKDRTEWHRVVIMNDKLAEIAEKYLKKGSKVYIEGQLQTRKWTDNTGQERYTTEVLIGRFKGELTLLDGRSGSGMDDGHSLSYNESFGSGSDMGGASFSGAGKTILDDDVPF